MEHLAGCGGILKRQIGGGHITNRNPYPVVDIIMCGHNPEKEDGEDISDASAEAAF